MDICTESQKNRRWLLRPWCVKTLIVLAIIAWVEFIAFGITAWIKAGHSGWFLLMIGAWPFAYGFSAMILYGMALVNDTGPPSERLPSMMRYIMPKLYFTVADYIYGFMANSGLIIFPAFVALAGGIGLWLALFGELNVPK